MIQNNPNLLHVIEQVSQEKSIEPKLLIEAVEQAVLTAAKKTFGPTRELEARFNEETGWVDLFQYMVVADDIADPEKEISVEDAKRHGLDSEEGEELGFQIFYRPEDLELAKQQDNEFGDLLRIKQKRHGFGRIAAQTAKQIIIQRVRDAERDRIHREFKEKIGEILTGIVRRFERGSSLIVDLGQGVEAVLPQKEQAQRESYRPGDRILAVLKGIDREAKGPQLILSRTDSNLLVKLFEMEVPEIYEGIVRIVSASREPGGRSKIAVSSRDSDVDPVGACVGMKGSRVQAVVQELRGEKIDIVPWDNDPARFVCNAIAPAEVVRVIIDEATHNMELVVPDAKLSLAIGKRGQNVRLASQLTGWTLDIVSESQSKEMEEEVISYFRRVKGCDEESAFQLYRMGFRSLFEIAEAHPEEITNLEGISKELKEKLQREAFVTIEEIRQELIFKASRSNEEISDKDKILMIRSVSPKLGETLMKARYSSVASIANEKDVERLARKTGISIEKASDLIDHAKTFIGAEWPNAVRIASDAEDDAEEQDGDLSEENPSSPKSPSSLDEETMPKEQTDA